MSELFDSFPCLESDRLTIRKMTESDVDALYEITENEKVYRYIPPFLYKKSRGELLSAIRNLGARDFDKKKYIIAGVYLNDEPNRLIGLAEIFDYKKRESLITVGYRLNEEYWHRGIATETIAIMKAYLINDIGLQTLKAFVMKENVYSSRALQKNGFTRSEATTTGSGWGFEETAELEEYTYRRL